MGVEVVVAASAVLVEGVCVVAVFATVSPVVVCFIAMFDAAVSRSTSTSSSTATRGDDDLRTVVGVIRADACFGASIAVDDVIVVVNAAAFAESGVLGCWCCCCWLHGLVVVVARRGGVDIGTA